MATENGIHFTGVKLIDLNFKLNQDFKKPKDGIPVDVTFKVQQRFSTDKKALYLTLTANLFNAEGIKPFVMTISMEGCFQSDDPNELKKFSKIHAPAHILPFIRETIGNITMKAGIPPLLLPPINMFEVLSPKKEK